MFMHFLLVILISLFILGFTISGSSEKKNIKNKDLNNISREPEIMDQKKTDKNKKQLKEMQGELDRLHNETWDDRYYKN